MPIALASPLSHSHDSYFNSRMRRLLLSEDPCQLEWKDTLLSLASAPALHRNKQQLKEPIIYF